MYCYVYFINGVIIGLETPCSAGSCAHPNALQWLACDLCTAWYHCECVGLTLKEASEKDFICLSCSSH